MAVLHNRVSQKELKERLFQESDPRTTISFYRYFPVEDPKVFSHGFGDDVVAIPFDAKGRVLFAPVYIYTIRPENLQKRRLAALYQGVTSQAEVQRIFGRPAIKGSVRGYQVWFYQIEVYNPFEEFPDIRG